MYRAIDPEKICPGQVNIGALRHDVKRYNGARVMLERLRQRRQDGAISDGQYYELREAALAGNIDYVVAKIGRKRKG